MSRQSKSVASGKASSKTGSNCDQPNACKDPCDSGHSTYTFAPNSVSVGIPSPEIIAQALLESPTFLSNILAKTHAELFRSSEPQKLVLAPSIGASEKRGLHIVDTLPECVLSWTRNTSGMVAYMNVLGSTPMSFDNKRANDVLFGNTLVERPEGTPAQMTGTTISCASSAGFVPEEFRPPHAQVISGLRILYKTPKGDHTDDADVTLMHDGRVILSFTVPSPMPDTFDMELRPCQLHYSIPE